MYTKERPDGLSDGHALLQVHGFLWIPRSVMEHCIKQNNAIDIYEEYFGEIEDVEFDQVIDFDLMFSND